MKDGIFKSVLMTQQEAAEYLGTTVGTLNTWRHYGKNPIPFVRWGNRIKYLKEDLENWIKENKQPASQNI